MQFVITGAAGMLGQDLAAAARSAGHEVLAFARAELDISDSGALEAVLGAAEANVVFNCAAWTDVDGAESSPEDALAVNGAGAGNVARAASASGAWTVHVSTDYVFDGTKRSPWVESDPVAPVSEYGRSKLAGELDVAAEAPGRHTIVRTSWLFGAGGPCFPATILRLAETRDELKVVDDQSGVRRTPGTSRRRWWTCRARVRPVGVLHVAGGGSCSWYEFAREIVAGSGLAVKSNVPTDEMPRPATRPAYSVLRSERGGGSSAGLARGLAEYIAVTGVVSPR